MRYMQIIEARDINEARQSYMQLLHRRGVSLAPTTAIFVEVVQRSPQVEDSWLCYLAAARPHAA